MDTETQERTVVYLGNRNAFEHITDPQTGERTTQPMEGKRCTTVMLAPDLTLMQAAQEITHPQGVWTAHSSGQPAWVASTNPALAQLLADHYGCELRQPEPHTDTTTGGDNTGQEG